MQSGYTKEYHSVRELLHRLPRKPNPTDYAILKAVSRLTVGWGKPEGDTLSAQQIADECFASKRTVLRVMPQFHQFGLITVTPQGRGRPNHYRLNLQTDATTASPPMTPWHTTDDTMAHTKEILQTNQIKVRVCETFGRARTRKPRLSETRVPERARPCAVDSKHTRPDSISGEEEAPQYDDDRDFARDCANTDFQFASLDEPGGTPVSTEAVCRDAVGAVGLGDGRAQEPVRADPGQFEDGGNAPVLLRGRPEAVRAECDLIAELPGPVGSARHVPGPLSDAEKAAFLGDIKRRLGVAI